jgi:hypothetical protein
VAGERSADDIQRDIERSRAALAKTVDELTYRTNPKRVADNAKQSAVQKASSPQGRAALGVVGLVLVVLVVRRVRRAARNSAGKKTK